VPGNIRAVPEISGQPFSFEAPGFFPSQLKRIEQGTILDEIIRSGVEIKFIFFLTSLLGMQ